MSTAQSAPRGPGRQFTLWSLFELTTLCGLLAALSAGLGIGPVLGLIGLAVGLHLRLGGLCLLMLAAAFASNDLWRAASSDEAYGRQFGLLAVAAAVCGWYRVRGVLLTKKKPLARGQRFA